MMMNINNQNINIHDDRTDPTTPLVDLMPTLQAFFTDELINETVQKHREKYNRWKQSDRYDGSPLDKNWGPASIIAELDKNTWVTIYINVTDTTATIRLFEVNDPPCKVSFGSILKGKSKREVIENEK